MNGNIHLVYRKKGLKLGQKWSKLRNSRGFKAKNDTGTLAMHSNIYNPVRKVKKFRNMGFSVVLLHFRSTTKGLILNQVHQ